MTPPLRPVVLSSILALAMVPFAILLWRQWNPEFGFYSAVLLLEAAAVIWMDARVRFSWWVLGLLGLWAVMHMAGGLLPIPQSITEPGRPATLYNMRIGPMMPKYDQIVHAFGFGVATAASWEAIRVLGRGSIRPGIGLAALLICVGSGLGALNEVIEFAATRIMPETNVGGYDNTGWDLVSNLAGSGSVAAWAGLIRPRLDRARVKAIAGTGPAAPAD